MTVPDLIERTRRRIGAALALSSGRHSRHHRRTARVRPYASRIPRTPAPEPYEIPPRAAIVRPYVLDTAHCARRRAEQRQEAQERADRTRLGVAALLDISEDVLA